MGYCNRLDTEAGRKIQLSYITLNIKKYLQKCKTMQIFSLKIYFRKNEFV